MALSKESLQSRIVGAFESQGAKSSGQHSWVNRMAEAIAQAVVDEIQNNAEVPVTSGSSTGTYKVN